MNGEKKRYTTDASTPEMESVRTEVITIFVKVLYEVPCDPFSDFTPKIDEEVN